MWPTRVPAVLRVASGGVWSSIGTESCSSSCWAVLQTAARMTPLAISTPTATPRSPLSPTSVGGRPVPARRSASDTSMIVPASSSSSMTLLTVERDRPISASARRLSAPRSRSARTTRPRLAERCADGTGDDIAPSSAEVGPSIGAIADSSQYCGTLSANLPCY